MLTIYFWACDLTLMWFVVNTSRLHWRNIFFLWECLLIGHSLLFRDESHFYFPILALEPNWFGPLQAICMKPHPSVFKSQSCSVWNTLFLCYHPSALVHRIISPFFFSVQFPENGGEEFEKGISFSIKTLNFFHLQIVQLWVSAWVLINIRRKFPGDG